MTKQQFLEYCLNTYGTSPDYPFDEDFETAVLRHGENRKWYALVCGYHDASSVLTATRSSTLSI